jgi:predicted component of type VI protein secretion system
VRGEVAFERIKGLNGALVETPNPMDEFTADIEQQLEIYEPRIQADSIDIDGTAADIGNYGVVTRLRRKETPEA